MNREKKIDAEKETKKKKGRLKKREKAGKRIWLVIWFWFVVSNTGSKAPDVLYQCRGATAVETGRWPSSVSDRSACSCRSLTGGTFFHTYCHPLSQEAITHTHSLTPALSYPHCLHTQLVEQEEVTWLLVAWIRQPILQSCLSLYSHWHSCAAITLVTSVVN